MTPQELKNSILQLAIEGRLVEQREEEGTAEELYAQIQAEKAKLIAEGKLKKQKALPEITEEEKPFEIPQSWKWVRLGEVTVFNSKNNLDDNIDVSFIPMACVSDGFNNKHTCEIKKWKDIKKGFNHFADGDIGVAKITPCFQNRKSVIFQNMKNGYGAGTTELVNIRSINNTVFNKYILWFLKSEYFIVNGVKSFTGTAGQQRINKSYLPNCVFPLPPLAEQHRIVAKIEELLPHIERYEKAWSRLEDFNKRFPSEMQKSLLQYAIEGRLVEQREEEGTAEELYAQIQAEKAKLIAEGKLKKQKALPEITEAEKPFEIPKSWKWVRLGEIVKAISVGGDKPKNFSKSITKSFSVPVIANGITNEGIFGYTDVATIKETSITVSGRGTIGYTVIRNYPYLPIVRVIVVLPMKLIDMKFLKYSLDALLEHGIGSAVKQLTVPMIIPKVLPLPPLAEQHRIVARLEELLPLCERLKK